MAERSDLTTFWEESPRLIELAEPATDIVVQDIHDTLNSNTEQASHTDDSLDNMDDDPLIDSAGKEDLGDGREVAITATFQNAQLMPESRLTPTETGTITTANAAGTELIDAAADFSNVTRGAYVVNFTDQSVTEVLEVLSASAPGRLRTRVLRAGTDNDYDLNDAYKIWNVIQINVGGGNLVAVDTDGVTPISPVFPTFATQILRTTSSSATALSQEELLFAGAVWIDSTDGNDANSGSQQDPVATVAQALVIGGTKNIHQFKLRGAPVFSSDPVPSEYDGYGGGANVVLAPGANLSKTVWRDVSFDGSVSGDMGLTAVSDEVRIERCTFNNSDTFSGLHGNITRCTFDQTTLQPVAGAPLVVADCVGLTAASVPSLTIDGTAGAIDVSVRRLAAGVVLQNITNASAVLTVGVNEGKITLEDSITAGTIVLRGTGAVVDNRTVFTATVINEVIDPIKIKETHTLLGLEKGNRVTITPAGVDSQNGDIDVNFTSDGVNTTTMERQ